MNLAVVILNWNEADDTVACLRSVEAWGSTPSVFVVDNGSQPPGIDPIRRDFPDVHVLESPVNRGFAGGCNLGIKAALKNGADAVLLLNNDASIDGSSLKALVAALESDAAIGIVGPVVGHDGNDFTVGGRDIARHWNTHLKLPEPPTALMDVDYVPGTVVLVRTQVFERVGLLDEDFFFGGEMADLCRRALEHGFRSVTDPSAVGMHDLDRSASDRGVLHSYYIIRNRFLFVRKHFPRRRGRLYARWTTRGLVTALMALRRGDRKRAKAVALGVVDGLRGRFGGQNERVLA